MSWDKDFFSSGGISDGPSTRGRLGHSSADTSAWLGGAHSGWGVHFLTLHHRLHFAQVPFGERSEAGKAAASAVSGPGPSQRSAGCPEVCHAPLAPAADLRPDIAVLSISSGRKHSRERNRMGAVCVCAQTPVFAYVCRQKRR